ncbi:hypothetical protein HMI56_001190, partial [Coelomomyces lativittatus]
MSSSSASSSVSSSSSPNPPLPSNNPPVPFTPEIVRFTPFRLTPPLVFSYASSSQGEPPHPESVWVNRHHTFSVYNLTKPGGQAILEEPQELNHEFFQDMEDQYCNIPDSEWKDHLVTAVLINIWSPHAHTRLPPGVKTLDYFKKQMFVFMFDFFFTLNISIPAIMIVDLFRFFQNALDKLYISFQDHLALNFYTLEIEYFQNNYFFYKENDRAELLDDYEVTPPKLPEPLLLPAPSPLCIYDSSSQESASISSSVPGTLTPGSSASLPKKALRSSTLGPSSSTTSKHSKKHNTKSSWDPSSTTTSQSSTPTPKHPPSKDRPLLPKNSQPPQDPISTKSSKTTGVQPQSWVWSHFLLQSDGVSQVCQVRLPNSSICRKALPHDKTGSTKAMATHLEWAHGLSSSSSLISIPESE